MVRPSPPCPAIDILAASIFGQRRRYPGCIRFILEPSPVVFLPQTDKNSVVRGEGKANRHDHGSRGRLSRVASRRLRGTAQGLDPDSQHQCPARPRRRHAAGGGLHPRRPGGHGPEGRADRNPETSDRLCRVAAVPRQADDPDLRPLRCPAAGAARAVAFAPLRADRPQRKPLRPGRHRRQGPDVHALEGRRGLAQDRRASCRSMSRS